MPDEVREHLARDQRPFLPPESLQTLQIHSSMTVLLLFSSPHSFSIGFRSGNWNGHSRSLVLCSVTHFCVVFEVCVWIIVRLEDPNMAHYKISNRVSHFRPHSTTSSDSLNKRLLFVTLNRRDLISSLHYTIYILHCLFVCLFVYFTGLHSIYHVPYATLSIFYIIIFIFYFFSTCPYLYICNSCILCMYACMYMYMYIYIYIYIYIYCICMHVCMYIYIYIYLICTYLYFCVLLLVFSVICMHQGVRE